MKIPRKDSYSDSDVWELYINNGNNDFTKKYTGSLSNGYFFGSYGGIINKKYGLNYTDIDGDGTDEIALYELQKFSMISPEWSEFNRLKVVPCEYAPGSTPQQPRPVYCMIKIRWFKYNGTTCNELPYSWANPQDKILYGDFWGNGKISEYSMSGGMFYTTGNNTAPHPLHEYDLYPLDLNGDGKTELLAVGSNSCLGAQMTNLVNHNTIFTDNNINKNHKLYFGDFNGDGKVDILSWNNNWKIFYSTGSGLSAPEVIQLHQNVNPESDDNNNRYFVRDFDGDGKADIMELITAGSSTYAYIHFRQGNTFYKESFSISTSDLKEKNLYLVDFNGDGQYELLHKNKSSSFHLQIKPQNKSLLVNSITNGFRQKAEVSYKLLTEGGVFYTKQSASFPTPTIQIPMYVVSSVKFMNTVDDPVIVNYKYEGAQLYKQGKGFLGFFKNTSDNLTTGISTIIETTIAVPL